MHPVFERLTSYCNSKSCGGAKKKLNFSLTSFILRPIEQIAQDLCMSRNTCLTFWRSLDSRDFEDDCD